jgi:chromosome segregation ATPase
VSDPLTGGAALVSAATAIAAAAAYWSQSRKAKDETTRRAAADWQSVAEAHEARVTQLDAALKGHQQQLETLAARLVEIEADREFLRQTNLDLQKKLSRAVQRIRALEANLRRARVPLPPVDEEGS